MGTVFNIQRFSLDDGDGIRTCVFFKGCPLRCVWCHNSESQSFDAELSYDAGKCIGCGACVGACERGCHVLAERHELRRELCVRCGKCAEVCPAKALERVGKPMSAEEVMAVVRRDRLFYADRGGMTLTGGEPMAQFDFALELAQMAKSEGISVVMETCGFAPTEHYLQIAPFVDCFYYDCKADSEHHRLLTGVEDELILRNLDVLIKSGAKVVLRCPVVPGANRTGAFLQKLIGLAEQYPELAGINLLPYHATGTGKPVFFGKEAQRQFTVPAEEIMQEWMTRIREKTKSRVW